MFDRPPSLLLHGFTGTPAAWDRVVARIDKRLPLVALPLPGHCGGLALTPGESFETVVDRWAAELLGRGLSNLHLVGYSLGGRLALALAVRHRTLARGLTLIGTHPGLPSESERQARRAHDARWIERLRLEPYAAFVAAWQHQPLLVPVATVPAAVLEAQSEERGRHSADQLALVLEQLGLAQMPCFLDDLASIALPIDWVVGAEDQPFRAHAEAVAPRLVRGRVVVIPGAGHNPVLEQPQALARLIEERAGA